jgi:hypothetical protein
MTEPKKPGRPRTGDRHKPSRTLRVTMDVYRRLEVIAARNDRPTLWEGKRAILAYVEAEEKRLGITPPKDSRKPPKNGE